MSQEGREFDRMYGLDKNELDDWAWRAAMPTTTWPYYGPGPCPECQDAGSPDGLICVAQGDGLNFVVSCRRCLGAWLVHACWTAAGHRRLLGVRPH